MLLFPCFWWAWVWMCRSGAWTFQWFCTSCLNRTAGQTAAAICIERKEEFWGSLLLQTQAHLTLHLPLHLTLNITDLLKSLGSVESLEKVSSWVLLLNSYPQLLKPVLGIWETQWNSWPRSVPCCIVTVTIHIYKWIFNRTAHRIAGKVLREDTGLLYAGGSKFTIVLQATYLCMLLQLEPIYIFYCSLLY